MQSAIGIIPARFQSSRLPGKALIDLCGKPMIQWVWEGARQAGSLDRLLIATDDERIAAAGRRFGAEVVRTDSDYSSGTDRIAGALESLDDTYDIVVNIQGDEPLLHGSVIDKLIAALERQPKADVSTPIANISEWEEVQNPSVVKVVINTHGEALYFSRASIPHLSADAENATPPNLYKKHIGLYAYRYAALRRFVSLAPSPLERAERLEQLRLLEDGATFTCVEVSDTLVAVDTLEDAARVRQIIRSLAE